MRNSPTMIVSMTGFARREATGPWGTLVCELRSVNHRFLECGFRLPDDLRGAESELRQIATRELKRGKVDCTSASAQATVRSRARHRPRRAGARFIPGARDCRRAPRAPHREPDGRVALAGRSAGRQRGGEELIGAAPRAVRRYGGRSRSGTSREGTRLRELIELRCSTLETSGRAVRTRLPEVQARVRGRLQRSPRGAESPGGSGSAGAGGCDAAAAAGRR